MEVANDVFLQTLEHARAGKLKGTISAWLRKTTRNRAVDRYRRNKTASEHEAGVVEELQLAGQPGEEQERAYPFERVVVRQVWRIMEQREKESALRDPDESDVQVLKWVEHGAEIEDLARYLGISRDHARQRKFRALKRFEDVMKELLEN